MFKVHHILKDINLTLMVFLVLSSSVLVAQNTLTLKDAIQYALTNSEVIKKAQFDIENGLNTVKETRSNALPQISVASNLTLNPLVQQFVLPGEAFGGEPGTFIAIKAGQPWNAMTALQVNQQVFNQQVFTGLKAAKGSAEFYQLMKEMSEENVVQQVATTYYQILLNQHKLGLLDDNIERVGKIESVLKGLLDNGLARKLDVDRVKVNRVNLQTTKSQLLNAIDMQKNVLKYYMAMPVNEQINLPESNVKEIESLVQTVVLDQDFDIESIIGVKVLRKQNELLLLQRDAFKAEAYPTAYLTGQYVQSTQSDKLNLYTKKALNFNMSNIALAVNIPIFDGNARKYKVEKAKVDLLKNESDVTETTQALQMAYQNARIQMLNSLETIQNQRENLNLAEEVYDNTNHNFQLGLVNLTDLLNAEAELTSTQNSYNEALLQYKISELELIKARGDIKTLAY